MTFVKICGLSTPEHIVAAHAADAIGLVVLSPESHRNLDVDEATRLAALAGPFQTTVAVTAHRTTEGLLDLVRRMRPQGVQIPFRAGQPAFESLRAAFPTLRILVACRPEDAHLVPDKLIDGIVLDAAAVDGYGGKGILTDWTNARAVRAATTAPIVLAGGLTPDNVAEAIQQVRPYAVDVSTGVETNRAKDPEKIRRFIEQARSVAK